ncbi:MAG TPA: DUF1579 family protein [Fimbriimonadaceae bacterium]|nr:DUF1579 family protein [Fimbriimonadaceae bacterium]
MTIALVLATVLVTARQEQAAPPPELKALSFMMGDFSSDMKMYQPGSDQAIPLVGSITTKETLGGMWIESRHDGKLGGIAVQALEMITYDPVKKEYVAHWYDSGGPSSMELRGHLNDQTLVMTSEPMEFPGMHDKASFRATYTKSADDLYTESVEMDTGQGWSILMDGTMTRK